MSPSLFHRVDVFFAPLFSPRRCLFRVFVSPRLRFFAAVIRIDLTNLGMLYRVACGDALDKMERPARGRKLVPA